MCAQAQSCLPAWKHIPTSRTSRCSGPRHQLCSCNSMASWVFCNYCFQSPRRTSSFSLTSCGHVYCDACLGKGRGSVGRGSPGAEVPEGPDGVRSMGWRFQGQNPECGNYKAPAEGGNPTGDGNSWFGAG
ncbi:Hypothetical predicted protein [Marmota monax]|uniref:RING-type domain-containing protein n=1 Tax=Marmota monax TaxID=9995 RepID=A0A5E4BN65_MARMO|nr:hypothetical protein GHT09_008795 [Marmota monax]VTJ71113.1 Hypothetical predicted protein [Marmota monax]